MSEQVGGILELPSSFNFGRETIDHYRSKSIDSNRFYDWSKDNMYKSSYAHYHSKDSTNPKTTVIPGYGGYIPYVKPQEIHAKGYSNISKLCLNKETLAKNIIGLSTTGANLNRQALIDTSKNGQTSKYGKTAIQRAHPAWSEGKWISTTKQCYQHPDSQINPTFRATDKNLMTNKSFTKGSGFATNHAFLDGTGWNPELVLKGDNHRSEYRDRFNPEQQFHRDTFIGKQRKLPRIEKNYKFN